MDGLPVNVKNLVYQLQPLHICLIRNNSPTLPALEAICRALGITLSQFFAEDNVISLTEEQFRLLSSRGRLSDEQRKLLLDFFDTM